MTKAAESDSQTTRAACERFKPAALKRQHRSTKLPGGITLQTAELSASHADPGFQLSLAATRVGMSFGDAAVPESFLVL